MRRLLIIFSLLSLLGGRAHAQHLYASVRQNGAELESLGTADFNVDADSPATVEFVDGKAVMTIGDHRVALLPMSDGGELVLAFETTLANDAINRVVKSPSERLPYATVYSPFQLVVPSGCEVYAPTFDSGSMTLHAGETERLKAGDIVAPETPLLVHGTGELSFGFSADAPTTTPISALSGSSLKIACPTDAPIFTFGIGKSGTHKGEFGLFRYKGTSLGAGLCYLSVPSTSAASFVGISFDSTTDGIGSIEHPATRLGVTKYIDHGRIVISKNGRKYNLNGQTLK
jgi:hypothetical protein